MTTVVPSAPTLRSLLRELSAGELTPEEAVRDTAERAQALPPKLNPFMCVDFDLSIDNARQLDRAAGPQPLFGLPIALKDLEPTHDLPTTFGAGYVDASAPRADGSITARLRDAGCLIYGKTSTPAYGHKDVTDNVITGITRNPWNPDLTPGGSSGGAAVVVATGVSLVAHGTDAAGSVRMPAALCGVVGFKPSFGRLPRVPSPDLWAARGHHGFLAQSVDDIRICMNAIAGGDPRDPIAPSEARWDDAPHRSPRAKVAFVDSLFGQEIDNGVADLMHTVADLLSVSGVELETPAVTWDNPVRWANIYAALHERHHFGEAYRSTPELFSRTQAAMIEEGAQYGVSDLFEIQSARSALHLKATEFITDYDFILTPTLPRVAWDCLVDFPSINGKPVPWAPGGRWADVLLANLTGWPAISIPCGYVDGLPVGLQIIAPWRADGPCLDFAAQIEQVLRPLTSARRLPMITG